MDTHPSTGASIEPSSGAATGLWRAHLEGRRVEHSRLACLVFIRSLGVCLMVAGWSLATQVKGLFGQHGIWPVASVMAWAREQHMNPLRFPTLLWWSSSDPALVALSVLTAVCGALLVVGIAPGWAMLTALLAYGSLFRVGTPFLSFQWDSLLLETLALALLLCPPGFGRPVPLGRRRFHSTGFWLLQVLGFKLMLSAGLIKLASQDPAWRDGTALSYHFWTQPLPTWTAWYMNRLPALALHALQLAMFFVELVLPFALLFGGRVRAVAGWGFIALMAGIAATGNYTFFNLLTAALAALWIGDAFWPRPWRRATTSPAGGFRQTALPARAVCALLLGLMIPIHLWQTVLAAQPRDGSARRPPALPAPWSLVGRELGALGLCNGYGLFAAMTKTRPEIQIELSPDGQVWLPVAFPHKPGDVRKAPAFVAPHQPRLDWQMWFAALADGHPEPWTQNPWLINLLQRLLERRPEVLALLADVPSGSPPPRFARAVLYYYTFSEPAAHAADGSWWRVTGGPRLFVPPVALRDAPAGP